MQYVVVSNMNHAVSDSRQDKCPGKPDITGGNCLKLEQEQYDNVKKYWQLEQVDQIV